MNYWFEIAIISSIFAIGNIFFGHFEELTPKPRKVAKIILFWGLSIAISALAGRTGFYVFLAGILGIFLVIHGWYLPKQGINGLTGEPKERYYQFRGWKLPQNPS
jgi:hypothetical protein